MTVVKRIASIDIGTNTLLLTIAEIKYINNNPEIKVLEDIHKIARLGFKVDNTKKISEEAIQRASIILEEYQDLIKKYNVDKVSIIGTSALRDATNKDYVVKELEKVINYPISIIDGETEAKLSFLGTIEALEDSIVLDIGGGSTEIIYGKNKEIIYRKSIDIGAVRITERFFSTIPPNENEVEKAKNFIIEQLNIVKQDLINKQNEVIENLQNNNINCYAVAGTATTMASITSSIYEFDYKKIHNLKITLIDLEKSTIEILKYDKITLENEFKVLDKRSDILQGGALILLTFLKYFGLESYICSCKGLRFGPIIQYSMDINKI